MGSLQFNLIVFVAFYDVSLLLIKYSKSINSSLSLNLGFLFVVVLTTYD